jgi:hypothetical protein
MGGFGSGRYGGGPTVESTFRIDIDSLRRHGLIRLGAPVAVSSGFPAPITTSMWNAKLISMVRGAAFA